MIVVTTVMRSRVEMTAQNTSSNVTMVGVFWELGNVTGMRTVLMVLMRRMRFVTTENVTRRRSSPVTMANVFPSCGTATLMTIVEMTVTNLPISVVREIVLKVGEDVPVTTTTDVFLNGSSVMAKMTAEMEQMNCPRTVQFVRTRESSSAGTR